MSKGSNRAERLNPTERHYAARMKKFVASMKPNSVAIIVSNPERTRSNDTHHFFRQSSDILYLNGFDEPDCALVFSNMENKRGTLTMFVQPKDLAREQWTGIRSGVEGAKGLYLADDAHTVDKFDSVVRKLVSEADNVYYKFGRNEDFDKKFQSIWSTYPRALHNPEDITHGLRMIKNAEEVRLMQEAARISAEAHCAAMKRSAPGVKEYQLQATMEFVFRDQGAVAPAYTSIVATGNNGWVLHYISNQNELKDGEMVLIDAACEYKGYAADITRTFPVNGKFTPAQRDIYQLVLDAQLAAIKAAKPGMTLAKLHDIARGVLRRGLVKRGILAPELNTNAREAALLKKQKDGKVSGIVPLSVFYPHGTGHWLGLDVHDVGTNGTRSDVAKHRPLEPGMVFTVEPGLYFDIDDTRVPEKYRGISVRIEDDVLITKDGHVVLTSGVPKEIADIERLMSRK